MTIQVGVRPRKRFFFSPPLTTRPPSHLIVNRPTICPSFPPPSVREDLDRTTHLAAFKTLLLTDLVFRAPNRPPFPPDHLAELCPPAVSSLLVGVWNPYFMNLNKNPYRAHNPRFYPAIPPTMCVFSQESPPSVNSRRTVCATACLLSLKTCPFTEFRSTRLLLATKHQNTKYMTQSQEIPMRNSLQLLNPFSSS